MYGLRSSLLGNLVEFGCFYLIQHLLPATLLIATPKRSPLRYACIPCMIWIASQFIHPIASSSSPTWCQMVSQLIIVTVQATHLLLINPLDRQDLSRGATHVRSYGTHLVRAVRLLVHTRGVNTPWQVKNVPSHPGYYARRGMSIPPRGRFLLRQSLILAWQYLALDIVQTVSLQQTSGLDSHKPMVSGIQWNVPAEQWIERVITHLPLWFFVTRVIGDSAYRMLSIIFVGLGVDSPSDWPPAWGRMADAYTLRNFWGKFWHQYLRQPFTSISNFAVRDVLRLPRSSILERYTNIFFVFLISGILHVIVDILQGLPAHRSGAMPFFLSFVLGIMLEDGAQAIWRHLFTSGDKKTPRKPSTREAVVPPLWQRILGLCWVWAWLAVTSTWYFTPMIQLTTKDSVMIPFSFAERMGLPVISSALLASGAVLAFAFEIEI